jgi:hypothetical protein
MRVQKRRLKRTGPSYPTMPRPFLPIKEIQTSKTAQDKKQQGEDALSWKKLFLLL